MLFLFSLVLTSTFVRILNEFLQEYLLDSQEMSVDVARAKLRK